MDPCFFLSCFHGVRASRLGHKRKEKNSEQEMCLSYFFTNQSKHSFQVCLWSCKDDGGGGKF